jgi:tetratricopeptide (TPR) repeat protein
MNEGVKNIYWEHDKPFCKHIDSGALVKFITLHFQGGAKKMIKDYFKGKLEYLKNIDKWSIKSINDFDDAIPSTSPYLQINIQLGELIKNIDKLMASERFDEVKIVIEEAIEKYPISPDLLAIYAELKLHIGEVEEAEKILMYLTGRWPNHVRPLNALAVLKTYKEAC